MGATCRGNQPCIYASHAYSDAQEPQSRPWTAWLSWQPAQKRCTCAVTCARVLALPWRRLRLGLRRLAGLSLTLFTACGPNWPRICHTAPLAPCLRLVIAEQQSCVSDHRSWPHRKQLTAGGAEHVPRLNNPHAALRPATASLAGPLLCQEATRQILNIPPSAVCCRRLAKRNSGRRPDDCCQILLDSVATGVEHAQRCLRVQPRALSCTLAVQAQQVRCRACRPCETG